ncbi:hypothetical protein NM688_g7899 [Phlebia brevispora]|uniref:Uncharacterized protein n=1 Tax=Phlebia brevispora TaxID=194682 RepID=A0ACC1RZU6_9APHY|nr:hypothetical protein NM688_g7899 [Phlebia brevispora]
MCRCAVMTPSEQTLPVKATMEIMHHLQTVTAPQIFTPRAAYDGRKNLFTTRELPFTDGTHQFDVSLHDPSTQPRPRGPPGRAPKVYKVKLAKVAEINPEILSRFLQGKQSHDNAVLTAITALNVVVRMAPTLNYPFNVRSFFTDREKQDIGNGLVLWRGYFQSVRPAIGRMLINIDISTAAMYKDGSLKDVCADFFKRGNRPFDDRLLFSRTLPPRERLRLQRFLYGIRITTIGPDGQLGKTPRVLKRLSEASARDHRFTLREGGTMTVMEYFQKTYNRTLQWPDFPCVEVGNGALIPMELCRVLPGQIMRKQIPSDKVKEVVKFSTKKPGERLSSIRNGLGVLAYGQSEYVQEFGMHVQDQQGPLSVNARILQPPKLQYGGQSAAIIPQDGAWNMANRKFYKPVTIERWCIAVFEKPARFGQPLANELIKQFAMACQDVGIIVSEKEPVIGYADPQNNISAHMFQFYLPQELKAIGQRSRNKHSQRLPNLIVAILPDNATELYTAIKHFGDVEVGIPTQCMKATKCTGANKQYYANVCLKVNVKLGGINTVPDPRSVAILTDPHNPTIVMGADVIHPAAHSEGRPSFAALVANVDSDTAKYIADCRVQTSRQEMIEDLEAMAKGMLEMYMDYRVKMEKKPNPAPKRIIFYRDGVSEGQFKQVLEKELPSIQKACASLNIKPGITVIVVGKRHHVRFFPMNPSEADKSGNCKAGTVIDREITHPLELDFYLQSHAGLLGTSRPAHYNVLHDDNGFSADAIQALSFALCHVYARSTRSVSIPAPVYYADIVCSRAKNHYAPESNLNLDSEDQTSATGTSAQNQFDLFKKEFKGLHANMKRLMYFS